MVPLDDFKLSGNPVAPLALIATPGAEEFAKLIDERLKKLFKDTLLILSILDSHLVMEKHYLMKQLEVKTSISLLM